MSDTSQSPQSEEVADCFACCVCFDIFRAPCLVTPCGHSFCAVCIHPCIDAKPQCPLCKASVKKEQLIRNYALERMASIVQQRQLTHCRTRELLDMLCVSSTRILSQTEQQMQEMTKSKVVQCLLAWQKYVHEMEKGYEKEQLSVAAHYDKLLQDKRNQFLLRGEQSFATDEELHRIQHEAASKNAQLNADLNNTLARTLSTFEAHLTSAVVAPNNMPVSIQVVIECRETDMKCIVGLLTNIKKLKKEVADFMTTTLGDSLNEDPWQKVKFFILRQHHAEVEILDELCPLLQLGIHIGDRISVRGPLITETTELPVCFTASFSPLNCKADFYVCETCKLTWVCGVCKEYCHSSHDCKSAIKSKSCQQGRCCCMNATCLAVHKHPGEAKKSHCKPGTCSASKQNVVSS